MFVPWIIALVTTLLSIYFSYIELTFRAWEQDVDQAVTIIKGACASGLKFNSLDTLEEVLLECPSLTTKLLSMSVLLDARDSGNLVATNVAELAEALLQQAKLKIEERVCTHSLSITECSARSYALSYSWRNNISNILKQHDINVSNLSPSYLHYLIPISITKLYAN